MRTFSKGRLTRAIAYLLTFTFAWTFTGAAAIPAAAQVVTRGGTAQTVAVIPFVNKTSYRPESLGEEAAATVSVELRDRLLLDVLPQADVANQMSDLGSRVPLSDVEMVRLATELDVPLLVAGEVRGARIVRTRDGRYGEVVLAVRLFDRLSRTDVNGAVAVAKGPASLDLSDEELLEKAMAQAAFSAIEQMKSRPTVTAMVLWAKGDLVFLNVGTRGGLRSGIRMVAVRGGERIGLLEVTDSDAIGSYAKSVEGPPLRTGDVLRAIFKMPEGVQVERVGVAEARKKTFETYAILAGLVFGLGGYASRTRSINEGNIAAPNFRVRQMANGAEHGLSGYFQSEHPGRDLFPTTCSIVSWDGYQGTEGIRVFGYEIVRGGQIVDVLVGGPSGVTFFDAPEPVGVMVVEITIDPVSGGVSDLLGEFTQWLPQEIDEETNDFSNPTFDEFVESNIDLTIIELDSDFRHYGWFTGDGDEPGAAIPGVEYQYAIAPILIHQVEAGGVFVWQFQDNVEFSTTPNVIRAISPAGVFSRDFPFVEFNGPYEVRDNVSNPLLTGNLASFVFYFPYGSDQTMLQITKVPNFFFEPDGVLEIQVPVFAPNEEPGTDKARVDGVDLSQVPTLPSSFDPPIFLWRIGARNFSDTRPPESTSNPADNGSVWSVRLSFDLSFTSRVAAMHEERETMAALKAARAARAVRKTGADRILRAQ